MILIEITPNASFYKGSNANNENECNKIEVQN